MAESIISSVDEDLVLEVKAKDIGALLRTTEEALARLRELVHWMPEEDRKRIEENEKENPYLSWGKAAFKPVRSQTAWSSGKLYLPDSVDASSREQGLPFVADIRRKQLEELEELIYEKAAGTKMKQLLGDGQKPKRYRIEVHNGQGKLVYSATQLANDGPIIHFGNDDGAAWPAGVYEVFIEEIKDGDD